MLSSQLLNVVESMVVVMRNRIYDTIHIRFQSVLSTIGEAENNEFQGSNDQISFLKAE